MKKILILLLLFYVSLAAQNDANVMSYYASDNNLDGQPRIDMLNVMRFFPVFAIQDSVTSVDITIYYGNKIFDAKADKMAGGKYWQTLLPDFKLGDAIQRVEVAMTIQLPNYFSQLLKNVDSTLKASKIDSRTIARKKNERIENEIKSLTNLKWTEVLKATEVLIDKSEVVDSFNFKNKESLNNIFSKETFFIRKNDNDKKEFLNEFYTLITNPDTYDKLVKIVDYKNSVISEYQQQLKSIDYLKAQKDSMVQSLYDKIVGRLADSSYSGPAIRKSDLLISDPDFEKATLLYRYYQNNLRYRKALDPAEHLGIFRARYIPFPVAGTPNDIKVQLLAPTQTGSPAVFEVGLSFGDDIVSGNNTFNPAFSASRLGVAMVITEKLFSSDAQIIGLALTYDFNSYASIGVGRNLAQGKSFPYYSFGINKKAFEQLLSALAGLFK